MQFLIQSSKLSLTISRAKLAHWALELKTTCRISALRKRMSYLQSFPQFHLGFSNALRVTSVYAVTIKQLLTQKCSNANSLSFTQEFSHHVDIYTDGSKDGIRTAAAVVAPNFVKTVRLPDSASIFTAKIHALDMALNIIRHTRSKDYVVFSDSLSSLQAVESCKVENALILKILKNHNQLINSGKSITFCWIPSHVGI